MFLVERVVDGITVRPCMDHLHDIMVNPPASDAQSLQQHHIEQTSTPQDQIETAMKKHIAKANAFKRRVAKISIEQSAVEQISTTLTTIERLSAGFDYLNSIMDDIGSIPPNSNFRRQNDN